MTTKLINISILDWIKYFIKFITYLNALFGFSIIVYFDTNLLFNIFDNIINWFKNIFYNLNQVFYVYIQKFLNFLKNYIESLITSDKQINTEKPVNSENINNKIYKDINTKVDIGEYKLNRKDYDQNLIDSKNNSSNKWNFIYSPYFYIPCIIIITVGGGFFYIYYYNIEYLNYIPYLGSIYNKINDSSNEKNNVNNNESLITFSGNNSPTSETSTSSGETITPSSSQFNKYFKEEDKRDIKNIDPWKN